MEDVQGNIPGGYLTFFVSGSASKTKYTRLIKED
jgi:hypothetical protein